MNPETNKFELLRPDTDQNEGPGGLQHVVAGDLSLASVGLLTGSSRRLIKKKRRAHLKLLRRYLFV